MPPHFQVGLCRQLLGESSPTLHSVGLHSFEYVIGARSPQFFEYGQAGFRPFAVGVPPKEA